MLIYWYSAGLNLIWRHLFNHISTAPAPFKTQNYRGTYLMYQERVSDRLFQMGGSDGGKGYIIVYVCICNSYIYVTHICLPNVVVYSYVACISVGFRAAEARNHVTWEAHPKVSSTFLRGQKSFRYRVVCPWEWTWPQGIPWGLERSCALESRVGFLDIAEVVAVVALQLGRSWM